MRSSRLGRVRAITRLAHREISIRTIGGHALAAAKGPPRQVPEGGEVSAAVKAAGGRGPEAPDPAHESEAQRHCRGAAGWPEEAAAGSPGEGRKPRRHSPLARPPGAWGPGGQGDGGSVGQR